MGIDIKLTTDEWTEITGLEDGNYYNVQCIDLTVGQPVEFFFTQSSSAPTNKNKGTYAFMGVSFKKGENKTFVRCVPNINVHLEEVS